MARKKTKKLEEELKVSVKNDKAESPIDTIIKDEKGKESDWNVKTLEVESDTKLESDKGEGQIFVLRNFFFKPNLEEFKKQIPTAQEILNSHLKQIEIELWKDEWVIFPEVQPRLVFMDKAFNMVPAYDPKLEYYTFIIAAVPAKGSLLSHYDRPKTLTEIAHESRRTEE